MNTPIYVLTNGAMNEKAVPWGWLSVGVSCLLISILVAKNYHELM